MDLYNTQPLDELEMELMDENSSYQSIDTPKMRQKYQQIAQNSIKNKSLINEIMQDKEFESFAKIVTESGLNIKDTLHHFFYQVSHGIISPKEFLSKN
jgi:hypothetical protein